MEIKGYTPPDKKVASETGVAMGPYPVSVEDDEGNVTEYQFDFVAKYSGTENKSFQRNAEKLRHKGDIRKKTNYKQTTEAALIEMLELWIDHIVVSWSTTVIDGDGNAIESNRENFIALLSMDLFVGIYLSLQNDCGIYSKFTKKAEKKAGKS